MRIITRPDFDGIVCVALLQEALGITNPVMWVEPNVMQNRQVDVRKGDIIANLTYHENCLLWFDHHVSNKMDINYHGLFRLSPSAARVVFDYFSHLELHTQPDLIKGKVQPFRRDFSELVMATDKIDAAQLSLEEVLHPEKFPYIGLSMTIKSHNFEDEPYWNLLVELLRKEDIQTILEHPQVKKRWSKIIFEDKTYHDILKTHTQLREHVSVTDFRSFKTIPTGNRFMVFSLFPESVVNVKVRYHDRDKDRVKVSLGHSIFNRNCNVNVGLLCSRFGGGGHRGAGSCNFPEIDADKHIKTILDILQRNEAE